MSTQKRTRRPNSIRATVLDGESNYPIEATDFEAAINTFIRNCRIRNLTEKSVKYYMNVLTEFHKVVTEIGVTRPMDITQHNVEDVILYKKREVSEVSVNMYLRGWRAFFRFLHEEAYIQHNPTEDIRLLKTERKVPQTFTREQLEKLFGETDKNTFTGYRDYVAMLMLLETGVRISELIGVRLTDIMWKDHVIKVYGKGRKERFVPFQKTLAKHLKEYVTIRGLLEHDFLFVNIDNSPVRQRTIQENIKKYGLSAGIRGMRVSPHIFRHTFAKYYIMNGGDAFSLQKILGHTSIDTVQLYVSMFGPLT